MIKPSLHSSVIIGVLTVTVAAILISSGYNTTSAMIIARSTTIQSTMGGEVTHLPKNVGGRISAGQRLAHIQSKRVDPGHLNALVTEKNLLLDELAINRSQLTNAQQMFKHYNDHSKRYRDWLQAEFLVELEQLAIKQSTAEQDLLLAQASLNRAQQLKQRGHVSPNELLRFQHQVSVAENDLALVHSQLTRVRKQTNQVEQNALYQEDGDDSHWSRMATEFNQKLVELNQNKTTINARIRNLEQQIELERQRIASLSNEEHIAPFSGIVNAVFASEGDLISPATPLMEILDCANPVVVVSVPEHRLGDYYIGQSATISPFDSDQIYAGQVQHISSGALIGRDTTLAIEPELLQSGSKITIELIQQQDNKISDVCETARRARVSIEVQSLLERVFS